MFRTELEGHQDAARALNHGFIPRTAEARTSRAQLPIGVFITSRVPVPDPVTFSLAELEARSLAPARLEAAAARSGRPDAGL